MDLLDIYDVELQGPEYERASLISTDVGRT
jgi:hypothetical protein